jgi:GNAT superfamily N-acetyltransferase
MRLREFAPSPERDDNDDVPDQLVVLANRWWNATDRQPQIEHVLNSLGWSIHQVESEDDAVQLQHRDGTTYFISADDFDPDLFEIARIPQGDFGDADTLATPKYDVKKKELPGGSGFTYAVGRPSAEDLEIMIFDGDTLAAELDLFETQDVTGAWRVNTVAVNPQYRSRGLGKALYGIALSILKLTIEAGDTQTKHGQRMWLMLNSIPGVEVLGYKMERTEKYKPRPGDTIIAQDDTWTRYTFPVKPGVNSMRSGRYGTGMYTSMASMIAKWTGK